MAGVHKIFACIKKMAWVHKILAGVENLARAKNDILYVPSLFIILQVFLLCIRS